MMTTNALEIKAKEDREIVMMCVFNAPREVVFDSFTRPELLKRWFFGPPGWSLLVCEINLRARGTYRYVWQSDRDGASMGSGGTYREVVAPERLVFVVSFSDPEGRTQRSPYNKDWPLEVLSTLTFSEKGGRTELTIHGFPINASKLELKTFADGSDSMRKGWVSTLDQLARHLTEV